METKLQRAFVGSSAGRAAFDCVVQRQFTCINQMTQPAGMAGTTPLTGHQPGVVGVALEQGLILALLALTAPVTGGYLNPAIAGCSGYSAGWRRRAAALIGAYFSAVCWPRSACV